MKQFIKFLPLMVIAFLFLTTGTAFAEKVTFVKEYNYNASDLDSKVSSRTIALEQVKRLLLEELGTYLISETEVKNFRLTKDQVTTYSAGVVSAEVIDEKWDGKTYYLKAKVSADPAEVAKSLQNIVNDKQKSKELEDVRKKAAEFSKEIERLKKELTIAKANSKTPAKADTNKVTQDYEALEKELFGTNKVTQYNDAIKGLSATDWIEKGKYLENKGELREAIDAYTKAIELNPEDPKTYFLRGRLYFKTGNYQNVLGDIGKANKFKHSNANLSVHLYNLQAAAYLKNGNYGAALESLEELIRRWPNLTFLEQKIEIEDIDKIIKKFPNDFRGYIVRGLYYGGSNMLTITDKTGELSIADYKRALNLNPKYALGYYLLGEAYSAKAMFNFNIEKPEEYQHALKAFTKAIELNLKSSEEVNVLYERGMVHLSLENYKEAIKDFNKAIEIDSKRALEGRGDAYFELGNYRQALADYDNAINLTSSKLGPCQYYCSGIFSLYGLYKKKGNTYFKMGNYKQAINAYDKTMEYYHRAYDEKNYPKGAARPAPPPGPTLSLIYEKRGISHFEVGSYELAFNDFKIAAKLGNKKAQDYLKSQGIKVEEQIKTAKGLYCRDDIDECEIKGLSYYKTGEYDKAIEIFSEMIVLRPFTVSYFVQRGNCYIKKGDNEKAILDFKYAARKGNKDAQEFLKSKGIEW